MNKKGIKNIIGLCFIYVFINLLIIRYIYNKNFYFKAGLPYFFDPDSYYYLQFFNIKVAYIFLFILIVFSITILYLIIKKYTRVPFIATILIITSTNFFSKMFFFYFDTQVLVVFLLLVMLGCILLDEYNKWARTAIFGLCWTILFFSWTGRPIIEIILLGGVIFALAFNKKWWLALLSSGIVALLIFGKRFLFLLDLKGLNVSEYTTPIYFLYYVIIGIAIYAYFKSKGKPFKNRMMFGSMLFTVILSLFIGRFSLFAIILVGIVIAQSKWYERNRKAVYLMIAINIIWIFVAHSGIEPPVDRVKEDLLTNCLEKDIPVVAFWDHGHIINYFSRNEVIMRANPGEKSELFNKAILERNISLFDELGGKDYYLYFEWKDQYKIKNAAYQNNFINSGNKDGFVVVCQTEQYNLMERSK